VIVVPAVDLRGGRCVRLWQGDPARETVFDDDPVAVARRWVERGAERLHVVDLDGAFAGRPRQTALIAAIAAAAAPVPVQAGGGLRDPADVDAVLEAGVRWAVVGTRAALDEGFLTAVCRRHPDRIIVAADGRDERVAVRGWVEVVPETVFDLARRARRAGAAAVLYTDVSRDGTAQGPNLPTTAALAREVGLPVLASGGVGTVDHLRALAGLPGVIGVIVGRALYTGAIDLAEAKRVAGRAERSEPGGSAAASRVEVRGVAAGGRGARDDAR
jgi:phosphoribosylformimino-5-aminoimidazole carboxamide ribotide isomerase